MALRLPSWLLLVLLQMFLVPAALAACPLNPCLNQPDCTGCVSGDKVPDPYDCHRFYLCTGNGSGDYVAEPGDCPSGKVFDLSVLACVEGSECPICPSLCHHDCYWGSPPFIASYDDCSVFYACSDGFPVGPLHCDSSKFFDGEKCQTEKALCCRCQPDCSQNDLPHIVRDPLDCRKYWICENTSPPTIHGMCDDGKAFDPIIEACSFEASCTTVCPNVVGLDGCIDPFICLSEGAHAKCPNECVREYYDCASVTYPDYQDPVQCGLGEVFHPVSGICVSILECP